MVDSGFWKQFHSMLQPFRFFNHNEPKVPWRAVMKGTFECLHFCFVSFVFRKKTSEIERMKHKPLLVIMLQCREGDLDETKPIQQEFQEM